jgi:hypothetical protein
MLNKIYEEPGANTFRFIICVKKCTILLINKLYKTHGMSKHTDCRRTAAIQQRVTAVLLSIPKEAFADSFQKLYERCQPCVVKDDDYFEGQ